MDRDSPPQAGHNKLSTLPAALIELPACSLRTLRLYANAAPPAALLLHAHVSAGAYLAVELCIAPRPSPSLKGDSAKYVQAFAGVTRVAALLFDGALPTLPNPGFDETLPARRMAPGAPPPPVSSELCDVTDGYRPWSGEARTEGRQASVPRPAYDEWVDAPDEPYPRVGAFEVVLRSARGLFVPLHSKVDCRAFPCTERFGARLLAAFGQPTEHLVLLRDGFHLHRAAAAGGTANLRRLLAVASQELDATDTDGKAPLHHACAHGRDECVALLLDARAAIDGRDASGRTPLATAAANGHAKCVHALIEARAQLHVADLTNRFTPLHQAVLAGSVSCARLLVNASADRDARDARKRTPLDLANDPALAARSDVISHKLRELLRVPAATEGGAADERLDTFARDGQPRGKPDASAAALLSTPSASEQALITDADVILEKHAAAVAAEAARERARLMTRGQQQQPQEASAGPTQHSSLAKSAVAAYRNEEKAKPALNRRASFLVEG
jgi:hypothetical protein